MGPLHIARLCGEPGVLRDAGGVVLAGRCHVTRGPLARAVGLLGTRRLEAGVALWLDRCAAVHTLGMAYPIACAFLDADGRVLRVVPLLPPGWAARCAGARAVVEGAPETLASVMSGVVLRWDPPRDLSALSDIPRA